MTEDGFQVDPVVFSEARVLLVEGSADEGFFKGLLSMLGVTGVQILQMAGKDMLRQRIKAISISSGFSTIAALGVTRDADDNVAGAIDSVRNGLSNAGLPAPNTPLEREDGPPAVVYMLFPKRGAAGELEDLCLESVANDPGISCVDGFISCLDGLDLPPRKNDAKARLQAFLVSRERCGMGLGAAAQANYFPWHDPVFDEVKEFIRLLLL